MLTVAQASELIFKDVPPREVVTLPLADSLACVLAEDVATNKVKILASAKVGQNICRFAEDLKEGEVVLKGGSLIRPQEIGVLAAVGRAEMRVYKKPHVAVISTGDELVEVAEKPTKGQIRNSNSYSVSAQVLAMGLECDNLGVARDTKGEIRR